MIRESDLPKKQVLAMEDSVRVVTASGDSVSTALNHLAQTVVENYEGLEIEGAYESVASAIANLLRSVGNNTGHIETLTNSVEAVQLDVSSLATSKADASDTEIDSDTQTIFEDLGWEQEIAVNVPSSIHRFTGKNMGVIEVGASNVSALPVTITNDRILENHVCIKAELSDPSAQTADWTVTTSDGSAEISGTNAISGTTDITLYLALKTND